MKTNTQTWIKRGLRAQAIIGITTSIIYESGSACSGANLMATHRSGKPKANKANMDINKDINMDINKPQNCTCPLRSQRSRDGVTGVICKLTNVWGYGLRQTLRSTWLRILMFLILYILGLNTADDVTLQYQYLDSKYCIYSISCLNLLVVIPL